MRRCDLCGASSRRPGEDWVFFFFFFLHREGAHIYSHINIICTICNLHHFVRGYLSISWRTVKEKAKVTEEGGEKSSCMCIKERKHDRVLQQSKHEMRLLVSSLESLREHTAS